MFTIDRCLECFYKDYDMFRLAGSICWLTSSDVTGDTSKRARGSGQPAEVIFCSFYFPHDALLPVAQLRLLITVLSLSWWSKRAAVPKCLAGKNRRRVRALVAPAAVIRLTRAATPPNIARCHWLSGERHDCNVSMRVLNSNASVTRCSALSLMSATRATCLRTRSETVHVE